MSRFNTLTKLIQKINQHLPTRTTKTIVHSLYHIPISFHHGQTLFISTQLYYNDDLKGILEIIVQNSELNSAELNVVTKLIPQPQPHLLSPQPLSPQPQQQSPQPLPYNNLDLNDPVSSYNNLETQDIFDIYTS